MKPDKITGTINVTINQVLNWQINEWKKYCTITIQIPQNTKTGGNGILGIIGGAANLGFEQAGNAMNESRRYNYDIQRGQKELMWSKEMSHWNMERQKELWEATGYVAQKDQMKRAGINPALMYGMGGGGGQTAAAAAAPTPSAGSASGGSNNAGGRVFDMASIAQIALLKAQEEKLKAETAQIKSQEGVNVATVPKLQEETKKTEQETKKSWQETHEIEMRNLITEITQNVKEDGSNAENIHDSAAVTAKLKELTANGIRNKLIETDIKVGEAQIDKMAADIAQKAQELIIQEGHLDVAKLLAEFNTDWGNILGKEAINAVGGIIQLMGLKTILGGSGHKAVEGFRRKSY